MASMKTHRDVTVEPTAGHPMFDLLDASDVQQSFDRGDVVDGRVALIGEHEILIDVGAKSEGLLSPREFSQLSNEDRQSFAVGDVVEVLIVNPQDRDGNLILSLAQAKLGQDWDVCEALHDDGTVFEESVSNHNKGGLIVFVGQVRGFVPTSQIDRRHAIDRARVDGTPESPLARLVGQPIFVKVIEIDRRRNRLILSEQAAMRERRKTSKAELLDELEVGQIIDGKVTSLADFGAFVDVGGADGLVHLSELSWQRVSHPREVLELGQKVTVKVISVDRERKRIGLSLKQLQSEPPSDLAERFEAGEVLSGTVTRLTEYGAFARLADDVEGLIHVSELSDDGRPPGEVVAVGDEVAVRVVRVDAERRRIGLSLRRAGAEFDDAELLDDDPIDGSDDDAIGDSDDDAIGDSDGDAIGDSDGDAIDDPDGDAIDGSDGDAIDDPDGDAIDNPDGDGTNSPDDTPSASVVSPEFDEKPVDPTDDRDSPVIEAPTEDTVPTAAS